MSLKPCSLTHYNQPHLPPLR